MTSFIFGILCYIYFGFLMGYAYSVVISRIFTSDKKINYVFGIDVPVLGGRYDGEEKFEKAHSKILELSKGESGIFIARFLSDLRNSISEPEDTAFYCYRSLETLMNHCAYTKAHVELSSKKKWEKFREIAECTESDLRSIKQSADPLRHGNHVAETIYDRAKVLELTWQIADGYLSSI